LVKDSKIENSSDSWFAPAHADAWGTTRADGTGWLRTYETSGGYPYITLGYLTSWTGAIKETDFPFRSSYELFDINNEYDVDYGATGIIYVDNSDTDTVKQCIMDYGSVVSSYNQLSRFATYNNLNYYCPSLQTTVVGHSINIVGWDDNYSKENFQTTSNNETYIPDNDGGWLCKNSWGTATGDKGYFWISYEDAYILGDKFGPNYAITDYEENTPTTSLYQVEKYGATYEFDYLNNFPSTNNVYINVFDFDNAEVLDKVVFESESAGADYTIYYIPMDITGATPDNNQSNWVALKEGTIPYAGYFSIDVEDIIVSGKGAVGVRINTTNTKIVNSIGVDEWLTSSRNNEYLFKPNAQSNVSYIYYKGKIQEIMNFYKTSLNDTEGGNLVIKAITHTILGDVNQDGVINITDATALQKHISQIELLSDKGATNGDFNQDGRLNIMDCTAIQKYIANNN
jgi:hypothetical protein